MAPRQNYEFILRVQLQQTTKTTSLYYDVNIGFVHRNWYETDTHTDRDGHTRADREKEDLSNKNRQRKIRHTYVGITVSDRRREKALKSKSRQRKRGHTYVGITVSDGRREKQ